MTQNVYYVQQKREVILQHRRGDHTQRFITEKRMTSGAITVLSLLTMHLGLYRTMQKMPEFPRNDIFSWEKFQWL